MTGIVRHPNGPRVYAAGLRIHHGSAGLAAVAVGLITHHRALVAAGLAAVAHDRRDFPFRDVDNH